MDTSSSTLTDLAPIAKRLELSVANIQATIDLLDEGNTVPFITRYRKDRTGGLDEQQVRRIQESVTRERQLQERKQKILKSIEVQQRLTDELRKKIDAATTLKALEDLYLPYKPKKQTLATIARQRGLEPLAQEVLTANPLSADFRKRCEEFVNEEKELRTVDDVETGVRHLLAEHFAEQVELRTLARKHMWKGEIVSKRIDKPADDSASAKDMEESFSASKEKQSNDLADSEAKGKNPQDEKVTTDQVESGTDQVSSVVESEQPEESQSSQAEAAPQQSEAPASASTEQPQGTQPSSEITELETESNSSCENSEKTSDTVPTTSSDEVAHESQGSVTDDAAAEGLDSADPSSQKKESQTDNTPENDVATPSQPSGTKSKKAGKTVAQSKAELAKQRREMRREARRRKRQKLEQSFKDYFDFKESIQKLPHYRTLALNRGERSKVLRVRVEFKSDQLKGEADSKLINESHPHCDLLRQCMGDALTRLVIPSIDREIRRDLTEKAESHAVMVFARNLRQLLLQAPLHHQRVLAIDPGFKSGCKLVAMDEFGNVLGHSLIHVIGSAQRVEESRKRLAAEIEKHDITVVAIGNGTACRETEQMVAQAISENLAEREIGYLIVNEAGASVYSTSPIGREELPRFDATVRGAVSIGRRTLDPLSELVKIDPANIGVGLYQHDVKAKHLRDSLDAVVESCVNYVGVDVNSASPALLRYVSGLNQLTARRVYEYRQEHGPFKTRDELKQVPGVGEATFVQAAGFLRIADGDNPLDGTWIHPESYEVAQRVLEAAGCELSELRPQQTIASDSQQTATSGNADAENEDAENKSTSDQETTDNADSSQTDESDAASVTSPDCDAYRVDSHGSDRIDGANVTSHTR